MAKKHQSRLKVTTPDGYAYLTKRIVVKSAQSAGRKAASQAMKTMGYIVTVRHGWIVRENQDGTVVKLSPVSAE